MRYLLLFLIIAGLTAGPAWAEGGRNQAAAGKVERTKSADEKTAIPTPKVTVPDKDKSKKHEAVKDTLKEEYDYFVDKNGNGTDDRLVQSDGWKGKGREKATDRDSAKRSEKPSENSKPASTDKPAKSPEKRSK